MKGKSITVSLIIVLVASLSLAVYAEQPKTPPSKRVTIATTSTTGVFYPIGSSMAKVVADHSTVRVDVKPFGGSSTYIPLVNSGEVQMSINSGFELGMAYLGPEKFKVDGLNPYKPSPNLRLLMRGAPLTLAIFVKKDSDIKSVRDLKGRRVTGEYPAQLSIRFQIYAALASCGLTWKDVKVVPVPDFSKGVEAVKDGRADACEAVPGVAKIREAHAAVGFRVVSVCSDPEAVKRMRNALPGLYPMLVKGGRFPTIPEDTWCMANDLYLSVNKNVPDDTVQEMLRCLWDFNKELAPLHPILKQWTPDRAVSPVVVLPYHEGAITFYKKKGVWTKEMEQHQAELVKQGTS
jgi:TRAP transporter TAXI family solute receptor